MLSEKDTLIWSKTTLNAEYAAPWPIPNKTPFSAYFCSRMVTYNYIGVPPRAWNITS